MLTPEEITKVRKAAGMPPLPTASPTAGGTGYPTTPLMERLKARAASKGITFPEIPAPQPKKESLKERVAGVLNEGADRSQEAQDAYNRGEQSSLETGVQKFSEGLRTATGVAYETARSIPIIGATLDKFTEGVGSLVKKGLDSNVAKELVEDYDSFSPRTKRNLSALMEIGGAVLGAGGAKALEAPVKSALKKTLEIAAETASKAKTAVRAAEGARAFEAGIEESKKILNPAQKYTPTETQKLYQKGEITEKGFGPTKREVANPKTTPQHETLAELVDSGKISAKNTPGKNISAIKQEARVFDRNIDEFVQRPDLNKPFNTNTLNKVFDGVESQAKDDLIFVADTTEEKIYKAVMDVAKQEIAKNPQNMAGLRASIKAFNARMEEILGKDIFTGASESVGNARLQAAKDVRTALNDFLADNLESPPIKIDKNLANTKVVNNLPAKSEYAAGGKLQGGGVYKNQLQKEAQLLNAADEIAYKSRSLLGKTKLGVFLETPTGKALKRSAKTAGIAGGAIGVADVLSGD